MCYYKMQDGHCCGHFSWRAELSVQAADIIREKTDSNFKFFPAPLNPKDLVLRNI